MPKHFRTAISPHPGLSLLRAPTNPPILSEAGFIMPGNDQLDRYIDALSPTEKAVFTESTIHIAERLLTYFNDTFLGNADITRAECLQALRLIAFVLLEDN